MTVHTVVSLSNDGDNYSAFLILKVKGRVCCYNLSWSVRIAWSNEPVGTIQTSTEIKFALT